MAHHPSLNAEGLAAFSSWLEHEFPWHDPEEVPVAALEAFQDADLNDQNPVYVRFEYHGFEWGVVADKPDSDRLRRILIWPRTSPGLLRLVALWEEERRPS